MQNEIWRSSNVAHDVLGGAVEGHGSISGPLGENEVQIDSGYNAVFPMMVNISDSNVLFQNPENTLFQRVKVVLEV